MRNGLSWGLAVLLGCCGLAAAENWGQWRGPGFDGSTADQKTPEQWSETQNVAWVASLPGPGASTPVVWGDRAFLTAADKTAKQVLGLAFDLRSGKELWRKTLGPDKAAAGGNDMASPSAVTDGQRVWFLAGGGELSAFTVDGRELWQRNLAKDYGSIAVVFGFSSSPLLYKGKLYIPVLRDNKLRDGETGPRDSFLLALDPETGRTLWKQTRDTDATSQSREAYVTPLPRETKDGSEIVIAGGECVTGHDAQTGAERWRWWFTPKDRQTLQHVVPTPVADGERVYAIRPEHRPLYAIRVDGAGAGELGEDHIAWKWEENRGWIASPLLYRGRLYVLQEEERRLACLDPRTGKIYWDQKLPASSSLQASPTASDGRIYCISLNGEVVVVAAGDEYRELFTVKLDDKPARSSIVASNGRLLIRTASKLWCIGK